MIVQQHISCTNHIYKREDIYRTIYGSQSLDVLPLFSTSPSPTSPARNPCSRIQSHQQRPNNPRRGRFTNEIGLEYSKQTLVSSTEFIWRLFQQNTEAERRNTQRVTLSIETMDGVAYSSNDEIHVSANYIQGYSGDVKKEITGILYHEMTHSWQWNGNGQTPVGLIEGIADFVRLKAGYAATYWVQPGQGDRWDQGYDVTAWFLDYCNGLKNGFVAELNKKMTSGYSANYFVELLGKTVDQLWTDYKAKYN